MDTRDGHRRHSPEALQRREELRERIGRFCDVPLALASIILVLLTIIQLSRELSPAWSRRVAVLGSAVWGLFLIEFIVKVALAPAKWNYLRRHWLDALIVLLPVLRILRVAELLRTARALSVVRMLILGGGSSSAAIELFRRRRLGQLGFVSLLVILLGAALAFLLESGVRGGTIRTFGDALWWSAALVTTVGSELYPATAGGRFLGFFLMLYAMAVFTYFTAALASVLIGGDARNPPAAGGIPPDEPSR
jgi:voltage-gated potassium channel